PPPGAVIMKSTGTAFSTPTATDSEKLSITTETPVIRVTPTASATAVAEARLGLRRALATASRPGVPSSRPGRKPTRRTAGPISAGPSATTPRKNSIPPPTTRASADGPLPITTTPTEATAAPSAQVAAPAATRAGPIGPDARSAVLFSAAIGGTLVAACAGSTAAATVTSRPAPNPSSKERGATVTIE